MVTSRRSRIFLRRRPLSCEVPSRRDSVGGGVVAELSVVSKADAIQWGGGSSRIFRGLRTDAIQWGGGVAEFSVIFKSRRDSVGGVVAWNFRLWGPFTLLDFPKGGGGAGPP